MIASLNVNCQDAVGSRVLFSIYQSREVGVLATEHEGERHLRGGGELDGGFIL